MALVDVLEAWKGKQIQEILKEYIHKNYTIKEIATDLKISEGTVHRWLSDYNITKQENMWR